MNFEIWGCSCLFHVLLDKKIQRRKISVKFKNPHVILKKAFNSPPMRK